MHQKIKHQFVLHTRYGLRYGPGLGLGLLLLLNSSQFAYSADPDLLWPSFRNGYQNQARSKYSVKQYGKNQKFRSIQDFKTKGLVWGTPVLDEKGNLYVGSSDKTFYSLDPNGKLRWTYKLFDLADSLIDSAAVLYPNSDLVVVPGGDGYLHGLNRNTGTRLWTFEAHHSPKDIHQSGVVVNSFEGNVKVGPNGLIYAGSDNGTMYALNNQGQEVWSLKTGMMIWSSPAFSTAGDWMAFGSLDGYLYLVDPQSGLIFDKWKSGSDIKSSPLTDELGNLYFGTSSGKFVSLRVVQKSSGFRLERNWSFQTDAEIYSSAAYKDGQLFFGSLDGRFYSLNTKGELLWKFIAHSRISSSALITQDDVVLFGARNGKLYALDAKSGERIWSLKTSEGEVKTNLDSSPVIDSKGRIYIGSYNGSVYSIPYEYCLKQPQNESCESGGKVDLPDYAESLPKDVATLQLEAQSEVPSHYIVPLRLVVMKNGDVVDRASIDASPGNLSVKIHPPVDFETEISSDGKHINLIPKTFFDPETHYQVEVSGLYYYQGRSWLKDRLKFFGRKRFESKIEFKTQSIQHNFFDELSPHRVFTWGLKSVYLTQPEALDTYLPAALDGQAFLISSFGFQTHGNKKAMMVAFPATANGSEFKLIPEPSKVFTLEGFYNKNLLKGLGQFRIAGMGGEMEFNPFSFAIQMDPSGNTLKGQFHAYSSCLNIKGNGTSYQFPASLVNQVCDPWLRVISVGNFEGGKILSDPLKRPILGKILSRKIESNTLKLRLQAVGDLQRFHSESHLVTFVQFDASRGKIIHYNTLKLDPEDMSDDGSWSQEFQLKRRANCMKDECTNHEGLVFLDSRPVGEAFDILN